MTARHTPKTHPEPSANARTHWLKAAQFAAAARQSAEDGLWDLATSSAAHAVISLSDMLCVFHLHALPAGESHDEALEVLSRIPDSPATGRAAVQAHLKQLLGMKRAAEYGERLTSEADAHAALQHMERAFRAVESLARANGWGP